MILSLSLNQPQRLHDVETRQADKPAADQRHGQQRAHSHRVVEGHDPERAFAVTVKVLRDVSDCGCSLGAMTPRHALRLRRSAGCIKHQRDGIGVYARRGRRCIGCNKLGKTGVGRRGLLRHGNARETMAGAAVGNVLGRHLLEGDRLSAGVLDRVIDLVDLGAPVDGRDDDAGELASPMQSGGLPSVLQHGDEAIPRRQPQLGKAGNHRRYFGVPIPVAQPNVAVDNGDGFRIAGDACKKARPKIKHGGTPGAVWRQLRAPPREWVHSRCSGRGGHQ